MATPTTSNQMIKYITKALQKPTVVSIIEREVYETRVGLLTAQSNLEYATAMVSYYNAKLRRLESTRS